MEEIKIASDSEVFVPLGWVLRARGDNVTLPFQKCVNVEHNDKELILTSTDNRRIHSATVPFCEMPEGCWHPTRNNTREIVLRPFNTGFPNWTHIRWDLEPVKKHQVVIKTEFRFSEVQRPLSEKRDDLGKVIGRLIAWYATNHPGGGALSANYLEDLWLPSTVFQAQFQIDKPGVKRPKKAYPPRHEVVFSCVYSKRVRLSTYIAPLL